MSGKQVEDAVEPAVVERVGGFFAHDRLGVIGNPHAGFGEHRQIAGAVTGGGTVAGAKLWSLRTSCSVWRLVSPSTTSPLTLPVSLPLRMSSWFATA